MTNISRLWDKLTARIQEDGGVLHMSSFKQEVEEWLAALPSPTTKRIIAVRPMVLDEWDDPGRPHIASSESLSDREFYRLLRPNKKGPEGP